MYSDEEFVDFVKQYFQGTDYFAFVDSKYRTDCANIDNAKNWTPEQKLLFLDIVEEIMMIRPNFKFLYVEFTQGHMNWSSNTTFGVDLQKIHQTHIDLYRIGFWRAEK